MAWRSRKAQRRSIEALEGGRHVIGMTKRQPGSVDPVLGPAKKPLFLHDFIPWRQSLGR
jgi:hypothetical protein